MAVESRQNEQPVMCVGVLHRASYVTPTSIFNSIRAVHPMFRGYYQHVSSRVKSSVRDLPVWLAASVSVTVKLQSVTSLTVFRKRVERFLFSCSFVDVAQWLGRRSLAVGLSLTYAWSTVDQFVGNLFTLGQPTRPTLPSIHLGSANE